MPTLFLPRALLPLLLLLLAPRLAWADSPGISLYESGEYEQAAQSFTQVLTDPRRPSQERAEARVYLAASLHALARTEEAREQLEVLAREHPEQRLDEVLFPPELVALAEAIHQRLETEREYARKEASQRAPPTAPSVPAYFRPEVLGLYDALGRQGVWGAGLAYHRGPLEVSAHALLSSYSHFRFQGGLLPGSGLTLGSAALQPYLGVRANLIPGAETYGVGGVAGARLTLPGGTVALVDVGVDYFFVSPDDIYQRWALTAQVGLGFDVRLSPGE